MRMKRIVLVLFALLFLLSVSLPAFAEEPEEDTPLGTVTCLTDLDAVFSVDNPLADGAAYRKQLYRLCQSLSANGKSDALLVLGDLTDNISLTKEMWNYSIKQMSQLFAEVSDTVLYTVGNNDYYAGEENGFNSADYYATVMTDRLGKPYYWDFCYETIARKRYVTAYRYHAAGVNFYFLNPTPTDMAGVLRRGNFVYTQTSLSWLEEKLENDDPNGDALCFLAAHFPLEGEGNQTGALASVSSERLSQICAAHTNLIYLSSDTYPAETIDETVTDYTEEGLILSDKEQSGIGLSSVWTLASQGDGIYSVKNAQTGTYLTVENGTELALSEEAASWNVTLQNGRLYLYATDRVTGVRLTKSGTAAFRIGTATPLELYARSTSEKGTTYTYSSELTSGADYVLVSDSRYVLSAGGEAVTTGETRVIGDELVEVESKTATEGALSFTSLSAGGADPVSGTVQFLTFTVYKDRVEFTLNNYTDGTVTAASSYTRHNRVPVTVRPKKGISDEIDKEPFQTKRYVAFLIGAGAVGAIGAAAVSFGIGRKRFFE